MTRSLPRRHSLALGMATAFLVGFTATPSLAQLGPGGGPVISGIPPESSVRIAPGYVETLNRPVRSVMPSRLRNLERREYEAIDLEGRRLEMSDREIRADVGLQLEAAGVACDVQGFKRVGTTPEAQSIYEAVCADGPGYVLVNGLEPSATNCLALAGAASSALRRDPRAAVGAQCTLPENQNGLQLIGNWAKEAGVACRIDQAEWLGPSENGSDIYEVGCQNSEGYWLEKVPSGWSLTGCLELGAAGLSCRFTDEGEQRAWMRARLAGTPAESCDVAEIRMIGVSNQGRHYEARCSTPNQGYLVRIAREEQAEDVTPCSEQQDCVLTTGTGRSDG